MLYGVLSILFGIVGAGTGDETPAMFLQGNYAPFIVAVACFAAVWGSRWLTMPSRMRAYEHAISACVDPDLLAYHFDMEDAEKRAKEEAKEQRQREKDFPKARVQNKPPPPAEPAREVVHAPPRTDEDMKKGPSILS